MFSSNILVIKVNLTCISEVVIGFLITRKGHDNLCLKLIIIKHSS